MDEILKMIDKAVAEERAAQKQADVDGRYFNAQGHGQAIGAYLQCREWIANVPDSTRTPEKS